MPVCHVLKLSKSNMASKMKTKSYHKSFNSTKVDEKAMIRNRYSQIPQPSPDIQTTQKAVVANRTLLTSILFENGICQLTIKYMYQYWLPLNKLETKKDTPAGSIVIVQNINRNDT